jgi:hypothetical protein
MKTRKQNYFVIIVREEEIVVVLRLGLVGKESEGTF